MAQKALLRGESEADFGRWIAFMSVANFAIAVLSWPMASVLRLGADEWARSKRLASTFALHGLLVLGSFVFVAAPTLEARELIDHYVYLPDATLLVLAYAVLAAAGNVFAAHLKPAHEVARFALLPLLTRFLWATTLVAIVFGRRRELTAHEVVLICLATALPQLLVGFAFIARKVLPPAPPRTQDADRALRFGLPVMARQLGVQAFAYVNFVLIYPMLRSIELAGRFQVAGALAEQAALLAGAIEDLVGPILARSATKGHEGTLQVYYRTLAPQVVLGWSTVWGAAILVARPILQALSAKAVEATAPALEVLFVATAVRVIVSLETPVLDAYLISGPVLVFTAVGFATNVGLDLALIPRLGIEGAAWGSLGGWLVNALARSVYCRGRFRVRSLALYPWVWPAVAALAWARLHATAGLVPDLVAACVLVLVALGVGRAARVFDPGTMAALEGVRMPARVRSLLERFYGR